MYPKTCSVLESKSGSCSSTIKPDMSLLMRKLLKVFFVIAGHRKRMSHYIFYDVTDLKTTSVKWFMVVEHTASQKRDAVFLSYVPL